MVSKAPRTISLVTGSAVLPARAGRGLGDGLRAGEGMPSAIQATRAARKTLRAAREPAPEAARGGVVLGQADARAGTPPEERIAEERHPDQGDHEPRVLARRWPPAILAAPLYARRMHRPDEVLEHAA